MLVLSRRKEEEIVIGKGVIVKVLEICGDKVKLGFTAPESITITRGEVKKGKPKNGVERQTS
jgi:carbon storage regulator